MTCCTATLAAAITDNVFLLIGIPMLAGWVLLRRRSGKTPVTDTGRGDCPDYGGGVDSAA